MRSSPRPEFTPDHWGEKIRRHDEFPLSSELYPIAMEVVQEVQTLSAADAVYVVIAMMTAMHNIGQVYNGARFDAE